MRKTLVALVLLVTAAITALVAQIRYLERGQAWVARG